MYRKQRKPLWKPLVRRIWRTEFNGECHQWKPDHECCDAEIPRRFFKTSINCHRRKWLKWPEFRYEENVGAWDVGTYHDGRQSRSWNPDGGFRVSYGRRVGLFVYEPLSSAIRIWAKLTGRCIFGVWNEHSFCVYLHLTLWDTIHQEYPDTPLRLDLVISGALHVEKSKIVLSNRRRQYTRRLQDQHPRPNTTHEASTTQVCQRMSATVYRTLTSFTITLFCKETAMTHRGLGSFLSSFHTLENLTAKGYVPSVHPVSHHPDLKHFCLHAIENPDRERPMLSVTEIHTILVHLLSQSHYTRDWLESGWRMG